MLERTINDKHSKLDKDVAIWDKRMRELADEEYKLFQSAFANSIERLGQGSDLELAGAVLLMRVLSEIGKMRIKQGGMAGFITPYGQRDGLRSIKDPDLNNLVKLGSTFLIKIQEDQQIPRFRKEGYLVEAAQKAITSPQ